MTALDINQYHIGNRRNDYQLASTYIRAIQHLLFLKIVSAFLSTQFDTSISTSRINTIKNFSGKKCVQQDFS